MKYLRRDRGNVAAASRDHVSRGGSYAGHGGRVRGGNIDRDSLQGSGSRDGARVDTDTRAGGRVPRSTRAWRSICRDDRRSRDLVALVDCGAQARPVGEEG